MAVRERQMQGLLGRKVAEVLGFDLRSLALFRIGLALVIFADLIVRSGDLTAHYTDDGLLPRTVVIEKIIHPWYWSVHLISGQGFVQGLLFLLAGFLAFCLLVGYRTRLATIASWAMLLSLHNRNPVLMFAADYVLLALLFWSMFLPLGACYSVDNALNSSGKPLPKRFVSGATFALILQICYIYMWSAAFKTQSEIWWPQGDAVYYALNFDQYGTAFGQFLLKFTWLLKPLTFMALGFEWLGPLLVFIPFRNGFFRCLAIISFILLHIGFGLSFTIGIFPYLSIIHWLVLIPSNFWDAIAQRLDNEQRQGLKIYYDADCGFCKKMVRLIRTFLILPGTPLLMAQDEPEIFADMQAKNSWVVLDWEDKRHFKWEAIAYVVSLSILFKPLAGILRLPPLMAIGTKFYEWIASHRQLAGKFTAPLKFRPLDVSPSLLVNIIALLLLTYTTVWNIRDFANHINRDSFVARTLRRRTFNSLDWISRLTRLDQSWRIFAPAPPRDDGWHVIQGKLADGSEIDVLKGSGPVSWEKPSLRQRNAMYGNMQWRSYFINLNRNIGKILYPYYGKYLCRDWNTRRQGGKRLQSLEIYFMKERTVPPGENQTVQKTSHWTESCFDDDAN